MLLHFDARHLCCIRADAATIATQRVDKRIRISNSFSDQTTPYTSGSRRMFISESFFAWLIIILLLYLLLLLQLLFITGLSLPSDVI